MDKYDISQPVRLKKGVYKLNAERNFDYQLNRVINWDGQSRLIGRRQNNDSVCYSRFFYDESIAQHIHDLSYQRVNHDIVVFFDEDFLCGKADCDEFHVVAGKFPVGIRCR